MPCSIYTCYSRSICDLTSSRRGLVSRYLYVLLITAKLVTGLTGFITETTREQIEVYIRDFSMPDPLSERPEDLVTSSILRCLTDIRDITRSYRKKHPHHARRFALSRESREKVDPTKDADDIIWSIEQHVQIVHIKRELKEFVNQYEEALEHLREMDE